MYCSGRSCLETGPRLTLAKNWRLKEKKRRRAGGEGRQSSHGITGTMDCSIVTGSHASMSDGMKGYHSFSVRMVSMVFQYLFTSNVRLSYM